MDRRGEQFTSGTRQDKDRVPLANLLAFWGYYELPGK